MGMEIIRCLRLGQTVVHGGSVRVLDNTTSIKALLPIVATMLKRLDTLKISFNKTESAFIFFFSEK